MQYQACRQEPHLRTQQIPMYMNHSLIAIQFQISPQCNGKELGGQGMKPVNTLTQNIHGTDLVQDDTKESSQTTRTAEVIVGPCGV